MTVVRGGFAAAGGFRPCRCRNPHHRSVSSRRSSHRTCELPASGARTGHQGCTHGRLRVRTVNRARPSISYSYSSRYCAVPRPGVLCFLPNHSRRRKRACASTASQVLHMCLHMCKLEWSLPAIPIMAMSPAETVATSGKNPVLDRVEGRRYAGMTAFSRHSSLHDATKTLAGVPPNTVMASPKRPAPSFARQSVRPSPPAHPLTWSFAPERTSRLLRRWRGVRRVPARPWRGR